MTLVEGIERRRGMTGTAAALGTRLKGTELVTLLLDVMRRRVETITAAEVLARHRSDRFVVPGEVDFDALRRAEDLTLTAVPSDFDRVVLSPLVPLGTHAVMAEVDQNRVVSTVRGTEVAADPTNGLALEAALRRQVLLSADPRSPEPVKLASVQRVTRGQRYGGPREYAHFSILGFVVAGRDIGDRRFELEAVPVFAEIVRAALCAAGLGEVRFEVADLVTGGRAADRLAETGAEVVAGSDRPYYAGLSIKAFARVGDGWWDLADGGLVDWTQRLVGSRKERLMVGGIGLDRLALQL
jgi:hypothetical protein